jgi:hypothetical protein
MHGKDYCIVPSLVTISVAVKCQSLVFPFEDVFEKTLERKIRGKREITRVNKKMKEKEKRRERERWKSGQKSECLCVWERERERKKKWKKEREK